MRLPAILPLLACSACASVAGSIMLGQLPVAVVPTGSADSGSGTLAPEAQQRLQDREKAALVTTTHDALAAAELHPDDLRLQRRAAALIRSVPKDAIDPAAIARVLDRLAATPCPGLADVAATKQALGDSLGAGETYLRAARQCESVDAAIAAVPPLRSADRCDEALDGLRAAWRLVDPHSQGAAVRVLDAVASCSDALSLRTNLAFVPPDIVDDYLALLDQRRREDEAAQARADEERREQEAEDRARDVAEHCESECSSFESQCESSCQGNSSCSQSCSADMHACLAGCGTP